MQRARSLAMLKQEQDQTMSSMAFGWLGCAVSNHPTQAHCRC